jgi:hypothetical protein
MKKIFGALMIAVCIGMAMPAQAQLHFGVKGGLNLSKASFSDVKENFKKDNFTGFFIGPMAEFNIFIHSIFIIIPEVCKVKILKRSVFHNRCF